MPPASNENQGLKIAVAAFVSLTVVLAVTSYFLYSGYSKASGQLVEAEKKAREAGTAQSTLQGQLNELRTQAGYANVEDFEALKAQIKKANEKLTSDIGQLNGEVKKRVTEYQQAGGSDPSVKELQTRADQIISTYTTEPNKTFASSLDRMKELLTNQALLTTAFAVDNLHLRDDLKAANDVNNEKLNVQTGAFNKSKTDLENEHNEHEKARQDLLAKVDRLQTDFNNLQSEYDNFKVQTGQAKEDYEKKINDFKTQIAYYKDVLEKKDTVIDSVDGRITAVDYTRNEVMTNLTRRMGVRAQMTFAVFDQNEPIPNDRPKATIKLISVDERGSIGKIERAARSGQSLQSAADIPAPIHRGDFLYSAVFDPNKPQRFALIGKIDMNRDGRDDRGELKLLIEKSGGIVEYDLPPPGAGKESGKLTALCSHYVIDERPALTDERVIARAESQEEVDFLKTQSEAIREARSLGIRPMTIERLLTYLGYSTGMANAGRVERIDEQAAESLLHPRGRVPINGSSDTPPAAPGSNNRGPR